MNTEDVRLSEISQSQKDKYWQDSTYRRYWGGPKVGWRLPGFGWLRGRGRRCLTGRISVGGDEKALAIPGGDGQGAL